MAELIDIEIGTERIRVPAWATEDTLTAMLKYNEIAARALNKLVGVGEVEKKTVKIQEHYFKQISTELEQSKKTQKQLLDNAKLDRKKETEETKDTIKHIKSISSNNKEMASYVDDMSTAIATNNFVLNLLSDKITTATVSFDELVKRVETTGLAISGQNKGSFNTDSLDSLTDMFKKYFDQQEKTKDEKRKEKEKESDFEVFTGKSELFKNIERLQKKAESGKIEPSSQLLQVILTTIDKKGFPIKGFNPKDLKSISTLVKEIQQGKQLQGSDKDAITSVLRNFKSEADEYKNIFDAFFKKYIKEDDFDNTKDQKILKSLNSLETGASAISNTVKSLFSGDFSLKSLAENIGKIVGSMSDFLANSTGIKAIGVIGPMVGAALGYMASTLESLSKSINELINVGASLGSSMVDLKNNATDVGMNLENFANLISKNSSALRILGSNTNEGMKNFAMLANQVRDISQQYNYFGMTNSELNEAIIQEIELRRKSGQTLSDLQNNLAAGFNELLFETTAMAKITGQDRRELLRAQNVAVSDQVISSYLRTLDEGQQSSFRSINNMVGFLGEDMTLAFQRAVSSGLSIDTLMGGQLSLAGEFGQDLRNLYDVYKSGVETGEDSVTLQSKLVSQLSNMTLPNEEILRTLGTVEGPMKEQANAILKLVQNISGLEGKTPQEIAREIAAAIGEQQSNDISALPAAIETMTNNLDAMMFRTMDSMLGFGETGSSILSGIEGISNMAEGEDLQGFIKNIWDALPTEAKIGAGLSAIIGLLSSIDRNILGLGPIITGAAGAAGGALGSAGAAGAGGLFANAGRSIMPFLKKAGLLGLGLSAGEGVFDEELQNAGAPLIDRALSGILGGGLSLLDFAAGAVNAPIDYAFGTNFGTPDLAGAWREYELQGYRAQQEYENRGSLIGDNTNNVNTIGTALSDNTNNSSTTTPTKPETPVIKSNDDIVASIGETNRLISALIRKYDETANN